MLATVGEESSNALELPDVYEKQLRTMSPLILQNCNILISQQHFMLSQYFTVIFSCLVLFWFGVLFH